jgi:hypothetical protein
LLVVALAALSLLQPAQWKTQLRHDVSLPRRMK